MQPCKYIKEAMFMILLVSIMMSCSETNPVITSNINETEILLDYLEQNGNIVNQPDIPYFVGSDEVFNNLKGVNYLVIDLRPSVEFGLGHIENSVNVLPANILDYFENRIEPNSFEKIILVCSNSHLSGYTTAILRMLGYTNVFHIRFGMSSWHESIAQRYWSANISNDLIGRLETTPHEKNQPGNLPQITTGKTSGYEILRERAQQALEINWDDISISFLDILEDPDAYYIGNYWPQALYDQGHLPGAIQYNPKKSLHSSEDILTLPGDKPLVFYCYSGQNSAYVNAFFSIMGYDFRSLDYGANGFIHQFIKETQPPGRTFSDFHIRNYPLEQGGLLESGSGNDLPEVKVETTVVQGGC
jgi:rhodanese-related sulfurtransferase